MANVTATPALTAPNTYPELADAALWNQFFANGQQPNQPQPATAQPGDWLADQGTDGYQSNLIQSLRASSKTPDTENPGVNFLPNPTIQSSGGMDRLGYNNSTITGTKPGSTTNTNSGSTFGNYTPGQAKIQPVAKTPATSGSLSDREVWNYMRNNPGMSDIDVYQWMSSNQVTPEQLGRSLNSDLQDIQDRYSAADTYTNNVLDWFKQNPGASDLAVYKAMKDNEVPLGALAEVIDTPLADLQSRYDAADTRSNDITNWLSSNPSASDLEIAQAMLGAGITPEELSIVIGMPLTDVSSRYNMALGN